MNTELGGSLRGLLNNRQLTSNEARLVACEVLIELEHLHEIQIIHRDTMPENLLLDIHGD